MHLPKEKWKNNYPIVLVYGMAGTSMDESYIFGECWGHFTKKRVCPHNDVYIAVVG